MRARQAVYIFIFYLSTIYASGQVVSAPVPQAASITGSVTDTDDATIPRATVMVDGAVPNDHRTILANDDGSFVINGLRPAVSYHITIRENGFTDWISSNVTLTPGQQLELTDIKLSVGAVETTVEAASSEQIALEQVKAEEQQRVFGIIPNFYVVYDPQFVPLTTKLKYQLAFRTATDAVSIASAGMLAGINQAGGTSPNYVQGAKGYGQRFGAAYGGGVANIMIGGAILPSLLHQDPRYFYQGTGTKKSRALHAMSAPFVAKGDNGHWQFNYSSVGGDLSSSALANLYYPKGDRGPGLVFSNAAITTGGRIVNALAQEFILSKLTKRAKEHN